jgi:hypothetical protein
MSRFDLPTLYERGIGIDIVEPRPWPFDRGARREAVLDPNWNNRVIRRVGWTSCMNCGAWFFSPDVAKVRLHGENCEQPRVVY